jgi:hypothetical protein
MNQGQRRAPFNVVRSDTGNSVGYRDTFNAAVALAKATRIKTGLRYGMVQIVRLGSERRIRKKVHPSYLRQKKAIEMRMSMNVRHNQPRLITDE